MKDPIYLDYNATTPPDPEVVAAMRPYLQEHFGNPSSSHVYGARAKKAVENARRQVASLLSCKPGEIVFTSGGTESNNYAIKGTAFALRDRGNHIITTQIEHPAVIEVCKFMEEHGFGVTYLPVDEFGRISVSDVEKAITPETILISVMHANNEVGTVEPIEQISELVKERGIVLHTDAAQSVGKIPTDVNMLGVDLLSVAGHKLYAPKGIGALYIREGAQPAKLIHGAGQEQGRRAGTENVLEIVGLGKACEIAKRDLEKNVSHTKATRDRLYNGLRDNLTDVRLNGHPEMRLPNTLSLTFLGVDASTLLSEIENQVTASAGAACHSGGVEISYTLKAMNVPVEWAKGTLRFSTGRMNTEREIDRAIEIISEAVLRIRQKGAEDMKSNKKSLYEMTHEQIKEAVKEKYGRVAEEPTATFNFPVGKAFALKVGYPKEILDELPQSMYESFTGANNPQPFVELKEGEVLLDLGCGAGLDLYFYAKAVGPKGKVYGLDISEKMVNKAKSNMSKIGIKNVEIRYGPSDAVPFDNNSMDIVASNGIYNLSPDKESVMNEVYRVLKPGGRTVFCEIVLKGPLPDDIRTDINDWFRCIGGALPETDFFSLMRKVGFVNIEIISKVRNARTGHKLAVCANVRAYKPT